MIWSWALQKLLWKSERVECFKKELESVERESCIILVRNENGRGGTIYRLCNNQNDTKYRLYNHFTAVGEVKWALFKKQSCWTGLPCRVGTSAQHGPCRWSGPAVTWAIDSPSGPCQPGLAHLTSLGCLKYIEVMIKTIHKKRSGVKSKVLNFISTSFKMSKH